MKELTIGNITIHRDNNDLYSLNDLHKAAGSEQRHKPANFMRLDSTQALIEELSPLVRMSTNVRCQDRSENLDIVIDKDQVTFGSKVLVYYYAMWISPAFYIQVLRAYDDWFYGTSTFSGRLMNGIAGTEKIKVTGLKQNSSPNLSEQIELSRSIVKMGHLLKKTVIATDPWARAQYLAMIKNYCDVTGTECIDPALIGTSTIKDDPPEVSKFWDTFESIDGGQQHLFNHSCSPELKIAIKLSHIYGHCHTQGISFQAHHILRPLLLMSGRYRYEGNTVIWSRLWHIPTRCMIFTKN